MEIDALLNKEVTHLLVLRVCSIIYLLIDNLQELHPTIFLVTNGNNKVIRFLVSRGYKFSDIKKQPLLIGWAAF